MKRNVLIFGLLCTVCMAVQARDCNIGFLHTPQYCEMLILVDYLPFKLVKHSEQDKYLYEESPLNFYLDTVPEFIYKAELYYFEETNSSCLYSYSKQAAKGYLKVNYDVYQFLVDKKIETMQHTYHYYINGKIIDKSNYEQLLRLRKSSIKSVNVELDSQTDAIIVEIKTKRRM